MQRWIFFLMAIALAGQLPQNAAAFPSPQRPTSTAVADRPSKNDDPIAAIENDATIDSLSSSPSINRFQRLMHRYSINDIDGLGDMVLPLIGALIRGDETDLSLLQQHLVAAAAVKFFVHRGEFDKAVVPFLIAKDRQQSLTNTNRRGMIDSLDTTFQNSYLPPLFLSDTQRTLVQSQINTAIENGSIVHSATAQQYLSPQPNSLSTPQREMVAAIAAAQTADPILDRHLLKLIEQFVIHRSDHYQLTHQSLALAIERLQQDRRVEEADRLRALFRTHFPDSKRVSR